MTPSVLQQFGVAKEPTPKSILGIRKFLRVASFFLRRDIMNHKNYALLLFHEHYIIARLNSQNKQKMGIFTRLQKSEAIKKITL